MSFRLVDLGWDKELDTAMQADCSHVRIVCPFIKKRSAERLLKYGKPKTLQVITRFNLADFSEGVSDIDALRLLLDNGAQIRGVRNLHAKLYLFGATRAIVTSANLTDAALFRNHEFGFVVEDASVISQCRQYFDNLWGRAGSDLSSKCLDDWDCKVTSHLVLGARHAPVSRLGDEGVDAGFPTDPIVLPTWFADPGQAFVKFFGESHRRANRSTLVLDQVQRSGCHWACTYPIGKRPRRVKNGALLFMGWLVKDPKDIIIFGRAIGLRYKPGRDDASAAELLQDDWRNKWPHYIRVHHAEFIADKLSHGVSLNDLMDALGSDAFASTQRNAAAGHGNIDPRNAYRQQAAVELSPQGIAWLNDRLEAAFVMHGKLAPSVLEQLD